MQHLYHKLIEYSQTDNYPYHMPGHKRRQQGFIPEDILRMDITEIDGFDNLQNPTGILSDIQQRASKVFHADRSYLLVNGSTCGILSAISAAIPRKGHILMARNSHKSAYHGAYLRQARITYLYLENVSNFDICEAISPKQVEEALQEHEDIDAVLIVSPTYEGRIADVRQIAEIVHQRKIPLIVDEAHGAHLGFSEEFAENSNQGNADLVIHSIHKTLPAMTQTAILHLNGNLIDRDRLERFLHIYQTSSPSYVLMASIENAVSFLEETSDFSFRFFYQQYHNMLNRLKSCTNIRILSCGSGKQDIGKMIIDCKNTELTGKQLYDYLRTDYHLQLEMACESYCLAMFTVADDEQAYNRMADAILQIDQAINKDSKKQSEFDSVRQTVYGKASEIVHGLDEAWDMSWESVIFSQSIGKTAADFISVYPPGVPILVPGERITLEVYEYINSLVKKNLAVQGLVLQNNQYMIKIYKGRNKNAENENYLYNRSGK